MRRFFVILLAALMTALSLTACGADPWVTDDVTDKTPAQVAYYDGVETDAYDSELFYRNDNLFSPAADPAVIWVPEDRHADQEGMEDVGGWFYMYFTSAKSRVARSKDLNNWEYVCETLHVDQDPEWAAITSASYPYGSNWAPEVFYYEDMADTTADDAMSGKYYMYLSSQCRTGSKYLTGEDKNLSGSDSFFIGVAVSDSPLGPFTLWHGTNADGVEIAADQPTFDFRNQSESVLGSLETGVIDASPYRDPDTGKLYLFFAGTNDRTTGTLANCMYACELKDPVTADYSTLVRVSTPTLVTPNEGTENDFESRVNKCNEGPQVTKHNGKYYLTYSDNYYTSRTYAVCVAVSDNPLGPYVKPQAKYGNPVLSIEVEQDHAGGPGHHSMVEVGDELFAVYHVHRSRADGIGNPRAVAVDRLEWVYDEELGYDMLYANGPTWSLQPLAEDISGYGNVAKGVTASVTNGSGVKNLTDGVFSTKSTHSKKEFTFDGSTEITLTFDSPVTVKAIMIYNSYDYDLAFSHIDEIEVGLAEYPLFSSYAGEYTGKVNFRNVRFNSNYYNAEKKIMRPGGSSLVEFDELNVNYVKIKVSKKLNKASQNNKIAISDIVVLGK